MKVSSPYYTPAGYERLRLRIQRAREDYLAVCRSNEEAAGAGDSSVWHDNFAYEENQRRMHQLATRVKELEHLAASARLVAPPPGATRATIGTSVEIRIDDGEPTTWHLVGFDDGDPESRRLSYNSPLGRALVGAAPGDIREVLLEGRELEVELVAIAKQPAPDI